MKKLLIAITLIITGVPVFAMTQAERDLEDKKDIEDNLIKGIDRDEIGRVQQAIKAGASPQEIQYLLSIKGEHPLTLAYHKGRYAIAEYLISQGADPSMLNPYLGDALSGNVEKVKWLLSHGVKDTDDAILTRVKEFEADEPYAPLKAQYGQIIRLFEQAKRGPVRLIPTARPAPAKQPLRLIPVTKPAAALPK